MRLTTVLNVRSARALSLAGSGLAKSITGVVIITAIAAVGFSVAAVSRSRVVAAQAPAPACTAGTIVNTENGPVCGLVDDGVTSYLGLPYAAPPVGALRWRPPAPVAAWTTTLHATQAGPNCPQLPYPPGSAPTGMTSEDCLTLNLYLPENAGPGLPVMVA
jgi:para-nitrobenzyl esterase